MAKETIEAKTRRTHTQLVYYRAGDVVTQEALCQIKSTPAATDNIEENGDGLYRAIYVTLEKINAV